MILAYLENSGEELPKLASVVVGAALSAKEARGGGEKVVGLLLGGAGVAEAAAKASELGLDEVVYLESESLANGLSLPLQSALEASAKELSPALIIAASNSRGKDVMPRLAHSLGAGQASDVLEFLAKGFYRRPVYAGDFIAEVEVLSDIQIATIRAAAFSAAAGGSTPSPVRKLEHALEASDAQTFVSFAATESERPELGDADVVISGGRALKSEENFQSILAPLADVLGAALGASRAAVDSGYAPNDWQVGQTGKVVAPNLYIAIGISGAIQHLAGMKDSKVIVAINKDGDAPIFEIADYGLVGDLFELVPELTESLSKAISG